MDITFIKKDNRWYADIPYDDPEELEMVEGADVLLQYLSEGHDQIRLTISLNKQKAKNPLHLQLIQHNECGATYQIGDDPKDTIWLCNVVHTLFQDHPRDLYITNYTLKV